jgi:hypothetical protein
MFLYEDEWGCGINGQQFLTYGAGICVNGALYRRGRNKVVA